MKILFPRVIALTLAVSLSGCAIVSPRLEPEVPVAGSWNESAPADAVGVTPTWWTSFNSPELASLVTEALACSPNLAVATERVKQAEAEVRVAGASLFPQLNLDGGASAHRSGNTAGAVPALTDSASSIELTASYELDLWGKNRAGVRAAESSAAASRFDRDTAQLTLVSGVATSYFDVLALRTRLAIARENLDIAQKVMDVVSARARDGAASALDVSRQQGTVDSQKAALVPLEQQERQTLAALAVLLGRPPEGFDVKAQNLDAVQSPKVGPGLPSELLLRRPDVAEAEANLASAHANVDAARAAFLPQISLTGSGGFVSTAIGTLLQGSNFGYEYGANLLQTIFDGGKLAGQKDLADATQQEFVARYQSAALNAYSDVETALIQVANTRKAEDHLRREVEAAREAFEITQLQYRQGATDLLNVLQAQQQLFGAEAQLAQTIQASRQSSVHLYEALGGGWVENPDDRTQMVQQASSAQQK